MHCYNPYVLIYNPIIPLYLTKSDEAMATALMSKYLNLPSETIHFIINPQFNIT